MSWGNFRGKSVCIDIYLTYTSERRICHFIITRIWVSNSAVMSAFFNKHICQETWILKEKVTFQMQTWLTVQKYTKRLIFTSKYSHIEDYRKWCKFHKSFFFLIKCYGENGGAVERARNWRMLEFSGLCHFYLNIFFCMFISFVCFSFLKNKRKICLMKMQESHRT